MLKIKLMPTGKKHDRHYRIVAVEGKSKLTGNPREVLGHYHPSTKQLILQKSRFLHWLSKGAQPSDKIRRIWRVFSST